MNFYNIDEKIFTDLWMYHCGNQKCIPSHHFGPAVRKQYLIHYIHSGCGKFVSSGKTYYLKKGQAFLIEPGQITYYEADKNDPWHYSWIAFGGIYAKNILNICNLSKDTPIYTAKNNNSVEKSLYKLINVCRIKMSQLEILGYLNLFFAEFIKQSNTKNELKPFKNSSEYVKNAVEFIRLNHHRQITIAEICNYIGIERSYLCRIFKEIHDVSPQKYIIEYKIKKAAELISEMKLSVSDAARSVGYEDQAAFSKLFKSYFGYSPSKLKR